jgi:dTDP-4-amino-4,6-dideoxygalactose transaminase
VSQHSFIPFHRPEIDHAEIDAVTSTLRTGWLTTGARTAQFEKEFRDYVGAREALALNSGTAALHLALAALGIGPGDEVITTPLTFCATVTAIMHVGATPVLADIGPDGNIDPVCIEHKITPRTRAVIPVHFAGAPCRMDEIWDLAKRYSLFVIEDAAHAAGTFYRERHVGAQSFASDAVAFSFYATKNMTTGEGGMITANSEALMARMRVLALHGINKDAWGRYRETGNWYYQVLEPGFKYNLSDIQSAIGIEQLHKLERFIQKRAEYAELYNQLLDGIEELELPQPARNGRHSWHLYVLRLNLEDLSIDRAAFVSELRNRGIGASVHFIPIPLHPFFHDRATQHENECPECFKLYPRLISLPLYPSMAEEELFYVAAAVREIVETFRKLKITAAGLDTGHAEHWSPL